MYVHIKSIYPCYFHRYVQSWIDKREVQSEKANLTVLFERYIPVLLECSRSNRFKKITPIQEVSMIQTLCYMLEALLTPANTPPDTAREVYELYFVFAAIWAFGGFYFQDQVHSHVDSMLPCKCDNVCLHACTYMYVHANNRFWLLQVDLLLWSTIHVCPYTSEKVYSL